MRYIALLTMAVVGASASATSLSAILTSDNAFTAYVSTDDSVEGTEFASGHNWPQQFTGSIELTPGVTNYLHIKAFNDGGPSMFIGSFTLSDSNARFANGTQSLVTNTTEWQGNLTGFGGAYTAPVDLGGDGTSPWGNFPDIAFGLQQQHSGSSE